MRPNRFVFPALLLLVSTWIPHALAAKMDDLIAGAKKEGMIEFYGPSTLGPQGAQALGAAGVATFRYQFPYMEEGRKSPDPPHVAEATVRSAVAAASRAAPELPLIAGGKSFGGRMTSSAASKSALPGVRGLAFLGFPLHPPNRPADSRAAHLNDVQLPMLFLQGTRDDLADLGLIRGVCDRLGARAVISFRMPDGVALPDLPPVSGQVDTLEPVIEVRSARPTEDLQILTSWALARDTHLAALAVTRPRLEDVYFELAVTPENLHG